MDFLELVKKHETALVEDLKGLIKIPSLLDESKKESNAPFGPGPREALDYMLDLATRDGFKTHDVDGYAGIIEYGEGEEIVGVLGHLDVVPAGTGWDSDPFDPVLKQGYLFGRGTSDDKGPSMGAYYALKVLKEQNIKTNKRIFLILGCDEETGMRCMAYYREHAPIPHLGFVPDADFPIIYGEKGILSIRLNSNEPSVILKFQAGERQNIVIGEAEATVSGLVKADLFNFYLQAHHLKGSYTINDDNTITYKIIGEFAHAAMPETGNNAGVHLLSFIGGAYDDKYALALSKLLNNYYGKGLDIMHLGTHMGLLTMNVGIINIVDGHQSITLDIRHPHDYDSELIIDKINQVVQNVAPEVSVEVVMASGPLFVDPTSKLVTTLVDCYQSISNDYLSPPKTIGGGTYARCFDNFVAFGPEFSHLEKPDFVGQIHSANEAISIQQLLTATAIYTKALFELTR